MSADLRNLVSPATAALVVQEGQRGVIGDESAFPELARAVADAGVIARMAVLAGAARLRGSRWSTPRPRTCRAASG